MRKIEGLFGSDLAFFILFWGGGDGVKPFPIVATRIYLIFFSSLEIPMNFHFSLFTGSGGCLSEAMLKLGALQDILRGGKGAVKNASKIKIQVG